MRMRAKTAELIKILNRASPQPPLSISSPSSSALLENAEASTPSSSAAVLDNRPAVWVHALGLESLGQPAMLRKMSSLNGSSSSASQRDFPFLENNRESDEEEEDKEKYSYVSASFKSVLEHLKSDP